MPPCCQAFRRALTNLPDRTFSGECTGANDNIAVRESIVFGPHTVPSLQLLYANLVQYRVCHVILGYFDFTPRPTDNILQCASRQSHVGGRVVGWLVAQLTKDHAGNAVVGLHCDVLVDEAPRV